MTDAELQAIKERSDAATPGPWKWDDPSYEDQEWDKTAQDPRKPDGELGAWKRVLNPNVRSELAPDVIKYYQCGSHCVSISPQDAAFIEQARADVPALVAEVERLRNRERIWERLTVDIADDAYGSAPPGIRLDALRNSVAVLTAQTPPPKSAEVAPSVSPTPDERPWLAPPA